MPVMVVVEAVCRMFPLPPDLESVMVPDQVAVPLQTKAAPLPTTTDGLAPRLADVEAAREKFPPVQLTTTWAAERTPLVSVWVLVEATPLKVSVETGFVRVVVALIVTLRETVIVGDELPVIVDPLLVTRLPVIERPPVQMHVPDTVKLLVPPFTTTEGFDPARVTVVEAAIAKPAVLLIVQLPVDAPPVSVTVVAAAPVAVMAIAPQVPPADTVKLPLTVSEVIAPDFDPVAPIVKTPVTLLVTAPLALKTPLTVRAPALPTLWMVGLAPKRAVVEAAMVVVPPVFPDASKIEPASLSPVSVIVADPAPVRVMVGMVFVRVPAGSKLIPPASERSGVEDAVTTPPEETVKVPVVEKAAVPVQVTVPVTVKAPEPWVTVGLAPRAREVDAAIVRAPVPVLLTRKDEAASLAPVSV